MLSSLEIFQNSIKTQRTLEIYTERLEQFHKFTKIKNYDSYTTMDHKQVENLVMEYVIYLKKKVEKGIIGPNAIAQRIAPIDLFMSQNDVMINTKKVHRMYPRKVKAKGALPYTLEDLQAMLESTRNPRDKAIITYFSSTGARPGSVSDLKMKHLKDMDLGCMAVTIYEDDIEEYPGFITPEGVHYLKRYFAEREFHGEKIDEESPVFRNAYRKKIAWRNVKSISQQALKGLMWDIVQRAKLRKKMPDSGMKHQKALFGAFRKWYETTLNNLNEVNANVTEKLMGHRNDLRGTYYNPNLEVRFENFKKAIPYLTISDKQRDAVKLKKLESKDDTIQELTNKIENQFKDNKTIREELQEIRLAFSKISTVTMRRKDYEKSVDVFNKTLDKTVNKKMDGTIITKEERDKELITEE